MGTVTGCAFSSSALRGVHRIASQYHQVQIRRAGQLHVLDDGDVLEPLNEQGPPAGFLPAAIRPPNVTGHVETRIRLKIEKSGWEDHDIESTHRELGKTAAPAAREGAAFAATQSRSNSLPSMSCITRHDSL